MMTASSGKLLEAGVTLMFLFFVLTLKKKETKYIGSVALLVLPRSIPQSAFSEIFCGFFGSNKRYLPLHFPTLAMLRSDFNYFLFSFYFLLGFLIALNT